MMSFNGKDAVHGDLLRHGNIGLARINNYGDYDLAEVTKCNIANENNMFAGLCGQSQTVCSKPPGTGQAD